MKTNLSRQTLSEQIAQQLVDFIFEQGLTPGDVLPSENRLAENFGVSRPIVREALKSLSAQGFIQVVNGKGAFVKQVDDKLLRLFFTQATQVGQNGLLDMLEIRKPLEIQSAILAAKRGSTEDIDQIMKTVSEMRMALTDLNRYAELDVQFHLYVAAAAHNEMLYHFISSIRHLLSDVVQEGLQLRDSREQFERMQIGHEKIAQAISQKNPEQAGQWMEAHFEEAWLFLTGSDPQTSIRIEDQ